MATEPSNDRITEIAFAFMGAKTLFSAIELGLFTELARGPLDAAGILAGTPGVFIRAPRIRRVGPAVTVLARQGGDPVLVREGPIWAATFHPELGGDDRVLRAWLDLPPQEERAAAPAG